jgi:hypothetical protein
MSGHHPWSEIKRHSEENTPEENFVYASATLKPVGTFRTRVNYPITWAEEGDRLSAVFYNQLLRLLIDIRDELWQLRQTNGMTTVNVPHVGQQTSNTTSLKDVTVTGAEKR